MPGARGKARLAELHVSRAKPAKVKVLRIICRKLKIKIKEEPGAISICSLSLTPSDHRDDNVGQRKGEPSDWNSISGLELPHIKQEQCDELSPDQITATIFDENSSHVNKIDTKESNSSGKNRTTATRNRLVNSFHEQPLQPSHTINSNTKWFSIKDQNGVSTRESNNTATKIRSVEPLPNICSQACQKRHSSNKGNRFNDRDNVSTQDSEMIAATDHLVKPISSSQKRISGTTENCLGGSNVSPKGKHHQTAQLPNERPQSSRTLDSDENIKIRGSVRPFSKQSPQALQMHNFDSDSLGKYLKKRNLVCSAKRSVQTVGVNHTGISSWNTGTVSPQRKSLIKRKKTSANKNRETGHPSCEKDQSFQCSFCSSTFTTIGNAKRHQKCHTDTKRFPCCYCKKLFMYPSKVREHEQIHIGEKKFHCQMCGKRFLRMKQLTSHERTHTAAKPYTCQVCNESFSVLSTMVAHNRIHTGQRPYTCGQCGDTFRVQSKMSRHMQSHTGEKPHKCRYCDKAFIRLYRVKEHEKTHKFCR